MAHTLIRSKSTRLTLELFLAAFLPLLFVWAPGASAQNNTTGLAISPPTFELSANPGDKLTHSIRVSNISDKTVDITIERRNFAPLGEEGQATLTQEENQFSLASWIAVTPETATIENGKSKTFEFVIDVPSNAEPGGHFGSVVFKTQAPAANQSGGVAVGEEVGSLILLRLAGDVHEEAQIESFHANEGFWEYGPIGFESRIKNTGNVHIKPAATITITDMFGREVATIPVESRNILPDSIRKFGSAWEQKNLFGRYTATLSVTYGDQKKIITSATSFVVIPYKLVGLVLIVLAIIGFFAYRGRSRIFKSLKVLFGKE